MKKIIILMFIILNVFLNNSMQANAQTLDEECRDDFFGTNSNCDEYNIKNNIKKEEERKKREEEYLKSPEYKAMIKRDEEIKKENEIKAIEWKKNTKNWVETDMSSIFYEQDNDEYKKFDNYNYNYNSWLKDYKENEKISIKGSLYPLVGGDDGYIGTFDNIYVSKKLGYGKSLGLFYKESDLLKIAKIKDGRKYIKASAEFMNHGTPMYFSKDISEESKSNYNSLSLFYGFKDSKVEGYIKHIKFNGSLCVSKTISKDVKKSNKDGYLLSGNEIFPSDCDLIPGLKQSIDYSYDLKNEFLRGKISEDDFSSKIDTLYKNTVKNLSVNKDDTFFQKPENINFNIDTTIFVVTKIIKNGNLKDNVATFESKNKKIKKEIYINKYKYNRLIKKIFNIAEKNDKIIPTILGKIEKLKNSDKVKKSKKLETILNYLDKQLISQQYIYKNTKKFKEMEGILSSLELFNIDEIRELFGF